MKSNHFLKILMLCLSLTLGAQISKAQGINPPPLVGDSLFLGNNIDLTIWPIGWDDQGTLIPHLPPAHVSNLASILGHNLYLYPLAEPQTVTVVLKNEEIEVYTETLYLGNQIELLAFPEDLQGEYTLYYYIGETRYRGFIEL